MLMVDEADAIEVSAEGGFIIDPRSVNRRVLISRTTSSRRMVGDDALLQRIERLAGPARW
jgi:hypothetical protein